MTTGAGEEHLLYGDTGAFTEVSTAAITATTIHGGGTVTVMDGTTGAGEATDTAMVGEAMDTGMVGEATVMVMEAITAPTSILHTIPATGLEIIITIGITLITLAGEVFTAPIPTLGALP